MSFNTDSLTTAAARATYGGITFAFQPIVDSRTHCVTSFEALVRGLDKQSAGEVFKRIDAEDLAAFDQHCRIRAITMATRLGLNCDLNINLLPRSLRSAENAILSTVEVARRNHLPLERIVLEITESEALGGIEHLSELTNSFRSLGIKLAIDDFGAGYSGLNLLAEFQPDQIKLDLQLVRGIESHGARQAIVRAIIQVCGDLGIDLIAEGVETVQEYAWFQEEGVHLFQGYLFAKPGFEKLPAAAYPQLV